MSMLPAAFRRFGVKVVRVLDPDSSDSGRTLEAHVQSTRAYFAVDAPVFTGAVIEVPDPRGGYARYSVDDVLVHDYGPPDLRHLEARLVELAREG